MDPEKSSTISESIGGEDDTAFLEKL